MMRQLTGSDSTRSRPRPLSAREVLAETAGTLLAALRQGGPDRPFTDEEARRLRDWLALYRASELSKIGFLREALESMVARKTASEADLLDVHLAIVRVVPALADAFDEATQPNWRDERLSEVQMSLVTRSRGSISPLATKGEAAHMLARLFGEQPITPRQAMAMRFWDRDPRPGESPLAISAWLEEFYQEDPDRRRAWNLFWAERARDAGESELAADGVGQTYLVRIKQGGIAALPKIVPERPTPPPGRPLARSRYLGFVLGAVVAAVVVVAFVVLRRDRSAGASLAGDGTMSRSMSPSQASVSARPDPVKEAVLALKLTSIVTVEEPRALIDGRLYRVGDQVDPQLKLRIVGIEAERGMVAFGDATGRIVSRSVALPEAGERRGWK